MLLRKKKPQSETTKITPEVQNRKLTPEKTPEVPQETAVSVESVPSLFRRAYQFSNLDQSYENQVTGLEYEPVGLFRRRRALFEENTNNAR